MLLRDAAHLAAVLRGQNGTESWWNPARFRGDYRKNDNWLEASVVAADVDYHDAAGNHVTMPADLRPRLEAAAREVGATLFHDTRRGGRLVFVFTKPCTDVQLWERAAHAMGRRLNRLLIGTGLQVDPVSCTPAQFFWAPNTLVDGVQRHAEIKVLGPARPIESLLDGSTDDHDDEGANDDKAAHDRTAPQVVAPNEDQSALLNEITAAVQQQAIGALLLAGEWRRANFKSSSEGYYVLTKMALRAASMREDLVLDWLMELPVWSDGAVDSEHPEKYTRREWVKKYVLWPAAADIRKNDPPPPDQVFKKLDSPSDVGNGSVQDTVTLQRAALQPGALSRMPEPRAFLLRHTTRNGQPTPMVEGDGFAPMALPGFLVSEGGVGKTMLLLALGVAVITGRPWLGFEVDRAHVGRGVFLVLAEETPAEVHRRLFEIAEAWNLSEAERRAVESKLFVLALSGQACALASMTRDGVPLPTDTFRRLDALLRESKEPWALVVLDPLARLFPGAEGGNVEATFAVQVIERLTTVPGGPLVLVAHHSSKIARRAGDVDARGVTGLADAARLVWSLKAVKDGLVEFAQLKANYAPPMPKALMLRRARGGLLRLATEEEIEAEQVAKASAADEEAATEVKRVVEAVMHAPNGRARTKAEIARLAKMKAGPARTAVDRAVAEGFLLLSGKGDERGYAVPSEAVRQVRSRGAGEEKPPYPQDRGTAGPDADAGPSVPRSGSPGPVRDRGTASSVEPLAPLLRSADGPNPGPDRDREPPVEDHATVLRELLGQEGPPTSDLL